MIPAKRTTKSKGIPLTEGDPPAVPVRLVQPPIEMNVSSRLLIITTILLGLSILIHVAFYTMLLGKADLLISESQQVRALISDDVTKRKIVTDDFKKSFEALTAKLAAMDPPPVVPKTPIEPKP